MLWVVSTLDLDDHSTYREHYWTQEQRKKDPTLDLNHLPLSNPRQAQVADFGNVTRGLAGRDQKPPVMPPTGVGPMTQRPLGQFSPSRQ